MRTNRFVGVAVAGVLLAGLVMAGTAVAQQPLDKRTYFTFSGPVAIPGVTLPAGKYIFRVVDTSSRNVIQVLSEDGMRGYAMFFAFRAERRDPAPAPEVRFMETAAGMPAAIQTWWYPGLRSGYEFVYPKEQARLLAKGDWPTCADHGRGNDDSPGNGCGRVDSDLPERRGAAGRNASAVRRTDSTRRSRAPDQTLMTERGQTAQAIA